VLESLRSQFRKNLAIMSRNGARVKQPQPQPSHSTPTMMHDEELLHATTRKESHSPPTAHKKMHAVVQGVSGLNLCTHTAPALPVLDPCNFFYYYEVGNDDGSHTTETATSSTISSLSLQLPSPISQGRAVRLMSPSEATSLLLPVTRPQPITSGRRHSTTSNEFSISGAANGKPGDRRQSTSSHCYSQSNNNKPPKNPETLERWSQLEWLQNQKKHRLEEDERQLELKRLWELQQQQQQEQEQQHFHPEERTVARRSQGPCDVDDVSVSSDDDQQPIPSRSKGPCDVDEMGMFSSDSSEDSFDDVIGACNGTSMDGDEVFNHRIEGYKDGIEYLRKEDTDSYEDPPVEAQTSYARQQLLRSSRYREVREQTKAQSKEDAAYYYQLDTDYLDEVELSRGLGGYEEGFGVPTINSSYGCHHLPLSIQEAEEEDEVSVSSFVSNEGGLKAGKNGSAGSTELETITAWDTLDSNSNNGQTRNMQSSWTCVHSRNGTCENCSNSGFMV
jgi:hypothetical protein